MLDFLLVHGHLNAFEVFFLVLVISLPLFLLAHHERPLVGAKLGILEFSLVPTIATDGFALSPGLPIVMQSDVGVLGLIYRLRYFLVGEPLRSQQRVLCGALSINFMLIKLFAYFPIMFALLFTQGIMIY